MSDFDKRIKAEMQSYVKRNIHFHSEDKEKIHSKVHKKKRNTFIYYGALTMTLFIMVLLIVPMLPDNNNDWNITLSGFSNKQTELKGMLKEPREKEEDSEIEEEPVEIENEPEEVNNEPVEEEQTEEIKEESVTETDEIEENKEEGKVEETVEQEEEEEVNQTMELTETEAWKLIKKLNATRTTLISLSDTENIHPEVVGHELIGFETADEVYALFSDFVVKDVLKYMYAFSVIEHENKVYLIPTDAGENFYFDLNTAIDMNKLDNEKYKIRQDVLDETTFNYYVEIIVMNVDGNWIIVDYASEVY